MSLIGPIIVTIMFGFFSFVCFYYTFRRYEHNDKIYLDIFPKNTFIYFMLMFQFILWVCKKLFKQKSYIKVFRMITFVLGLIFIGVIVLFWSLLS